MLFRGKQANICLNRDTTRRDTPILPPDRN
jgi:hypothetical protein